MEGSGLLPALGRRRGQTFSDPGSTKVAPGRGFLGGKIFLGGARYPSGDAVSFLVKLLLELVQTALFLQVL